MGTPTGGTFYPTDTKPEFSIGCFDGSSIISMMDKTCRTGTSTRKILKIQFEDMS